MVTYPIQVSGDAYRGSDSKKRTKAQDTNRLASRLQTHINEKLKEQVEPIRVYSYHEIAAETGIEYEIVRRLGYSIDGGSSGFTACKAGLTMQQAMDAAAEGKLS
jgi:hypothetical protein